MGALTSQLSNYNSNFTSATVFCTSGQMRRRSEYIRAIQFMRAYAGFRVQFVPSNRTRSCFERLMGTTDNDT